MYSKTKVDERLAIAERNLGFAPTYHSVDDVIQFESDLIRNQRYTYNDLHQIDGLTDVTPDEHRWMQNEQALCVCDAAYFLTRYGFLNSGGTGDDNRGMIQRFSFRVPQRIYFDILCELQARGLSLELLVLKARQLGVSVFTALLIAHRIFFSYGVNAVIGSADQKQTYLLSQMLLLCYDMLPYWLRPKYTARVEGERGRLMFAGLSSGVTFQHGSQKYGVGTGSTPTIYHLCLGEETKVRVADSGIKNVRDLIVGDHVIAPDGQMVAVNAVAQSPRTDPEMSQIDVWMSPFPLFLTKDHKVLTSYGKKSAGDLTPRDWLVYPLRSIQEPEAPFRIKNYVKWAGVYGRPINCRTIDVAPTYNIGWMAGLYLAEGCIGTSSFGKRPADLNFVIHRDEEPLFREQLESVPFITMRKTEFRRGPKTAVLVVNHRGWTEWVLENFGNKGTKRVPDACWNWGREFCQGLVDGYLAGDGHAPKLFNAIYATSVRPAISFGIRELVASLGHGWSGIHYRKGGRHYGRNCKETYTLAVSGNTVRSLLSKASDASPRSLSSHRYKMESGRILIKVKRVGRVPSSKFFNVEVDHPSHLYAAVDGVVANSEVALYGDDAVKLIDEGLWKAVHVSPAVIGILESTGRSNEGWWAKTWYYSKANYPNSRMYPMFLPWFCGVDIYPMPMDRVTHPIPSNWVPHRDTRLHANKAALYVASTPLLDKHLKAEQVRRGVRSASDPRPWTLPLEQQWFWEWNYEEAKFKDTEAKFLQEMAGDDEEALQRSTESVFGHKTIESIDLARQREFDTYTISGQSIEDAHEIDPSYFDYDHERLAVMYPSPRGTYSRWELIPLKPVEMRPDHPEDADSVLCVWEHPRPGYQYALGGDTSEGKGEDSTACAVWRLGYDEFPDVQVAEFASSTVSHVEAFAFFLCIAAYYAVPMRRDYEEGRSKWREPYVSIEQVAAVGDTAQHQMGLLGYTNFHKMPRYDGSPSRIRRQKRGHAAKTGWYTFGYTRPLLLGSFVHWARNGWAKVNSPWLLHEMRHFETHETATGKERMEHEEGEHDDRIFASAMSIFPPHDMDKMTHRSKKRIDLPSRLPDIDLSPYQGNVISAAELARPLSVATLDDVLYYERGLERYRDA